MPTAATATRCRRRKPAAAALLGPLPNVTGRARWLVAGAARLLAEAGTAPLSITAARSDGSEVTEFYWLCRDGVGDGDGDGGGWTLRKDGSEDAAYELDSGLTRCSCPDFATRARRRPDGCCKHLKGVRAALARLEATAE